MTAHVIYVATNALSGPHVQRQVLPYLARLAPQHRFTLLTHEERAAKHAPTLPANVRWDPLPRRRPPLGTFVAIEEGVRRVCKIAAADPPALLHARSYVGAAISQRAAQRLRIPWIFDMRGFYLDERIDGGLLRSGSLAERILRREERKLVETADAIVVLTRAAKTILETGRFGQPRSTIDIVPCGADLSLFTPPTTPPADPPVLAYTGTLGSFYLEREMAAFANELRQHRPDLRVFVASRQPTDPIRALLTDAGFAASDITTTSLAPDEVPAALRECHAGMILVRPSVAKVGSSPIKLSEYLGAGLPVVVSAGCGDVANWVDQARVGVTVNPYNPASLREGALRLHTLMSDVATPSRCREFAEAAFSVEGGAATYGRVYARLISP